jgi:hypothetical protein
MGNGRARGSGRHRVFAGGRSPACGQTILVGKGKLPGAALPAIVRENQRVFWRLKFARCGAIKIVACGGIIFALCQPRKGRLRAGESCSS